MPFLSYLKQQLNSSQLYLFPLRLFIALGWLRVGIEKLINPNWHKGHALENFIQQQEEAGLIFFTGYYHVLERLVLPFSVFWSEVFMVTQLLVGLALLVGAFSQLALLLALAMNFVFLMAGAANPSAFYIVIQLSLLFSHAGEVFGVDAYLSSRISSRWLVAQNKTARAVYSKADMERSFVAGFLLLSTAFGVLPFIQHFSPAKSIDDPAMLLFVLLNIGAIFALIRSLKIRTRLSDAVFETSFNQQPAKQARAVKMQGINLAKQLSLHDAE